MTYEEFQNRTKDSDYILIKLTDHFPFFHEKVIKENGVERTETNYHIADGMFSTYVNFEMLNNGFSAEVSRGFVRFEIGGKHDWTVYVTNVGTENIEISVPEQSWMYHDEENPDNIPEYHHRGTVAPGEVYAIYPDEAVKETVSKFYQELMNGYLNFLSQREINRLLSGK